MAGLVLVGALVAVQAAHKHLQEARSPLITLPATDAQPRPPSISSTKKLFRYSYGHSKRRRQSGSTTTAASRGCPNPQHNPTISKHSLKKLAARWQQRYWDIRFRIMEIQRSVDMRGWQVCWAGSTTDLSAMNEALTEADEMRRRLFAAVTHLKSLSTPLQPLSLNPLHRRQKDVLPLSELPPSLNGLPVPIPQPPKSNDFTPVLETLPPHYDGGDGVDDDDDRLELPPWAPTSPPPTEELPRYDHCTQSH